ncbi:MAG: hypothetical protein C5B50_04850 [Verrucomicrobia bacterium]|nr:MAG: hypothetical protein C5B50_04850 [Verrucomicrobiota bacterium]
MKRTLFVGRSSHSRSSLFCSADFQAAVSQRFQPARRIDYDTVISPSDGLPIGNRRYSRLEVCATRAATSRFCSADFQSAVSQCFQPASWPPSTVRTICRLEIGDTAGWKPALRFPSFPRRWALLSFLMGWFAFSWLADAATFTTLTAFYGTNGAQPAAGLLLGADGSFYGTTVSGGANGDGTVFRFTPGKGGGLTNLLDFTDADGSHPYASLVQDTNGIFYGTTSAGGEFNSGSVFAMASDAANGLTNVFAVSFDGTNSGGQPAAALVQGGDGRFYGTTQSGGAGGRGTIFAVSTAGVLSTLVAFSGTNGAGPVGALVQAPGTSNVFYGTTSAGGQVNSGTIFSFRPGPNNSLSVLHSFTGGADGGGPQAGLTLGADGNFYGTTAGGGTSGLGTVFQLRTGGQGGSLTNLFSFGGTNGTRPFAPLLQANGNTFYGTTFSGGANNHGTVFSITPDGSFTNLYSFRGGKDGAAPWFAGLRLGSDGNLYGVTSAGGAGSDGTLYELSGFPAVIVVSPASQGVTNGQRVTFAVSAAGSETLKYQWLFNSNNIAGANGATLTISNVSHSQAGTYTVLVQNKWGSVMSDGAVLEIIDPPTVYITSPNPKNLIKTSTVTVKGTTTDNVAVQFVYFQWNGSGWHLATPLSDWTQWSAPGLSVNPGTNILQVYAVNVSGFVSATHTTSFNGAVFLPVSGGYNGLFYDTNGVTVSSSGAISLTVMPAGDFHGYFQIGQQRFSCKGQFSPDGSATTAFQRPRQAALQANLQLDMVSGTDQLTGTLAALSNETWAAQILANRDVFDGKTIVCTNAGPYTLVVDGSSVLQGIGYSWATAVVNQAGRVRISGSLADGTKIAQSTVLSKEGQYPLFVPLYGGLGSLLGWISFSSTDTNDLYGAVVWTKPQMPKATYYSDGFTNDTFATGWHYSPGPLHATNLAVVLVGGDLAQPLTNYFAVRSNGSVPATNGASLNFSLSSGTFAGHIPNGRQPFSFSGVAVTNLTQGSGYFRGPTLTGQALLVPLMP